LSKTYVSTFLLLLLSFLISIKIISGTSTTSIAVNPSFTEVTFGSIFTLDLNVSDVTELYLWVVTVEWNPSVIEFQNYEEGPFLKAGGNTAIMDDGVSPGKVERLACTILGPVPGVDGGGSLVTFTFNAKTLGNTPVNITFSDLLNSNGEHIPHNTYDGVVQVTPLNTPPKASHLAISPSLPYTTDDLVGNYIYYDADGDPESGSEIRWYKDSVLQSAYNDQLRVFASATFEGDVWYFTVRPKDGTDLGDLAESNKVTVQSLPNYTLAIYSSPNGVTFKVDGVSRSTPWSGIYDEGTSVSLEMPETHVVDEARYYWDRWSDEVTSRSRTVTMYTDITLTAYFSAQPVARFTCSPAVPSVGEEITFDASSSLDLDEDIVSYRWDFYDGNISLVADSTIVHIYKFPGRFNVTLTVIDSKGVNCSYSQTVWVRMLTSVSISTSCPPTFVGFTVNVSGTLRDIHKNALKNETVFLYYTLGGTGTWSPITSEITDNLGNYFATWIPPIIDNFQIKVEWSGNSTHFGTSNVTSLNMHAHISISLSSSTSYVGFKVEINGNFTCNGIGYPEAPILLSYSVTGGESWNDITLVNTSSDGGYFAIWLPPATGSYFVKATWTGNPTYPGATTTVNLAVIPFEEQNVFSVTSNSTVSALAFNSTSRELSFTVTGSSGTTGYANVYIAKTLVENIADVKVYLNGNQLNYTVTSLDDSWLLHFTYQHSTHKVTVTLGYVSARFIETPLGKIIAIGIPIIAIVILIILYVLKRKRRSL